MTTIKITELTDIGANLASSTVLPVVNMSGTPTTQKTILGNIANVILGGAGGNYVAVGAATLAGTVTTNAQPNITSTGSLTGLTVSNAAGTVNFSNTANVTLGAVGNLHIAGGTAGQLLSTNGNGTLSWASDTTTYGNSNVVSLMASFGSNTITTTGNVSVGNIIGNGQALTNIAGANVSGTVGNANLAQYLNVSDVNNNFSYHVVLSAGSGDKSLHIDADDNLQYNPADGTLTATRVDATYVLADLQFSNGYPAANVTGLGNIATINLSGSNSNVLYGNGVFAAVVGGGNTGNVTFNDINIIGTGNLHLQPDPANAASYLDIFLTSGPDLHLVASNGANLILGEDDGPNVMTSWDGNVYIQSWDTGTGNVGGIWSFGGDGALTLPNDANIAIYGNTTQFNTCPNGFLGLNSYDAGSNNIARVGISSADKLVGIGVSDPITELDYNWSFINGGGTIFPTLTVDLHNGGNQTAQTLQFGDPTQQAIITGPTPSANVNAQRLIIQGQRGNGQNSEGGDVYVWAGDAQINGGDIKIYAGDADNASAGGGGYINLAGGDGFDNGGDITLNGGYSANGYGGQISITGGQGQTDGGPASITGGYATAGNGGAVNITGGTSSVGPSAYGNVEIGSGIYGWSFNNEGNLVLPGNTFAVNYANGTQVPLGGGGANTGNVTFSDQIVLGTGSNDGGGGLYLAPGPASIANSAVQYLRVRGGDYPTHIHLDTGNNEYYDQYFGADSRYVKLEANGNIVINADDYNGNAGTWTFDTTGNLTLPGDIVGTANANFTIYSNAAAHEFIFGDDGTFYAPDNVVLGGTSIYIGPGANTLTGIEHEVFIASSNNFAYVQAVVNNVSDNGSADWVALGAKGDDTGGQASLGFTSSGFGDANYSITGNGDGYVFVQSYGPGQTLLGGGGNLVLTTGSQGTTKDIIFGTGGFLSSNIFGRISHANNSLELSRTGATITFPDATEQNTAWTGSVTTIANGNSNVNIATSNGNIVITSAGTNGWNFDSTGNLTIPGSSGGFIKTVSNASIGVAAVDNGTNNPAQLLSMTNAGAATSIISAYATNATIQTNATGTLNTWQFDNAGNLTLPTSGHIIVSGGLVSSGASPAPTINGFSITNSVGISGNGNIAGNNISATGNVTAQGVGTNMVRRANTISGSNTAVTLDNLNAYVGGTPKRLYIGAATSNMTMAGQSQTMSTGALAVSSWINVPIVTGTGNGFAMSGAITNDGDTAVLNVTDQGAGSGTWRVTGMIANTSANLYSVSIERLA